MFKTGGDKRGEDNCAQQATNTQKVKSEEEEKKRRCWSSITAENRKYLVNWKRICISKE